MIVAPEKTPDFFELSKVLQVNQLVAESGSQAEILAVKSSAAQAGRRRGAKWSFKQGFEEFRILRSLLRRIKSFDVVLIEYTTEISFARLVLPLILLVKFFGKRVLLDYRHYAEFARIYDGGLIHNRVLGMCDRVLVLSAFQNHRLERCNLRGGFLPEYLRDVPSKPREIASIQPKLLVANPLEKISNTICAIRAYRLVKQKYPRTELIIAGEGTLKRALKAMVQREKIPGITFRALGSMDDLIQLLGEADLFVNCSYLDFVPPVMIEAAAYGLPVISTPSISVLNTFSDGESVLLGRHNDHVSLSDRIIELVENPQLVQRLSTQGAKKAADFQWEKIRPQWQSFFATLGD